MRVHRFSLPNDLGVETLQRLSQEAGRFRSDIYLEYEEEGNLFRIDVKSILGTMLLALRQGTEVLLRTKGTDEEEAIHWVSENLESGK